MFDLTYHHCSMELYNHTLKCTEVCRNTPTRQGLRLSDPSDTAEQCLHAAQGFLDTLMTWSVDEYHFLTFTDWMRLPCVVMTVCKLSFPSETTMTGEHIVQDRVRLGLYLESLCYRMQTLKTSRPPKKNVPDFWTAMQMILELVRAWYSQKLRQHGSATMTTPPFLNSVQSSVHVVSGHHSYATGSFLQSTAPINDGTTSIAGYETLPDVRLEFPDIMTHGSNRHMPTDFDFEQLMNMDLWGSMPFSSM